MFCFIIIIRYSLINRFKASMNQQEPCQKQQKNYRKPNLLLGVTGSVATIKLAALLKQLSPYFNIKVVATEYAKKFMHNEQNQANSIEKYKEIIHYDQMEWEMWKCRGDPVLHIQLRKWAEIMVIAPLSANTLAKLSNGICDNLLTLVCRAWSMQKYQLNTSRLKNRIIVCPSMNTLMWEHPITQKQINILKQWGYQILGPIEKKMMCGDIGNGAMIQLKDLVKYLLQSKVSQQQSKQFYQEDLKQY